MTLPKGKYYPVLVDYDLVTKGKARPAAGQFVSEDGSADYDFFTGSTKKVMPKSSIIFKDLPEFDEIKEMKQSLGSIYQGIKKHNKVMKVSYNGSQTGGFAPILARAGLMLAKNPALRKMAINTVKNPAFQQQALGAIQGFIPPQQQQRMRQMPQMQQQLNQRFQQMQQPRYQQMMPQQMMPQQYRGGAKKKRKSKKSKRKSKK